MSKESVVQAGRPQCVLFDWGDAIMRDLPQFDGPMCSWPLVEALDGANEVVAGLKRQFIIALATNAVDSDEDAIRRALERADLERFFDHVFCFRNLGHRKPWAEFFTAILERLGLPAESVFMVGDSFESDVLGANAVEIAAVWLNSRSQESRVSAFHLTAHELRSVPQALRELASSRERSGCREE